MMELSEAGVEYRYEDIQDMSDDGVNGQFCAVRPANLSIARIGLEALTANMGGSVASTSTTKASTRLAIWTRH